MRWKKLVTSVKTNTVNPFISAAFNNSSRLPAPGSVMFSAKNSNRKKTTINSIAIMLRFNCKQ